MKSRWAIGMMAALMCGVMVGLLPAQQRGQPARGSAVSTKGADPAATMAAWIANGATDALEKHSIFSTRDTRKVVRVVDTQPRVRTGPVRETALVFVGVMEAQDMGGAAAFLVNPSSGRTTVAHVNETFPQGRIKLIAMDHLVLEPTSGGEKSIGLGYSLAGEKQAVAVTAPAAPTAPSGTPGAPGDGTAAPDGTTDGSAGGTPAAPAAPMPADLSGMSAAERLRLRRQLELQGAKPPAAPDTTAAPDGAPGTN